MKSVQRGAATIEYIDRFLKKIINAPENYTDDILKGIYAAHEKMVKYAGDDLRCFCTAKKTPGKVAIITGAGSGSSCRTAVYCRFEAIFLDIRELFGCETRMP